MFQTFFLYKIGLALYVTIFLMRCIEYRRRTQTLLVSRVTRYRLGEKSYTCNVGGRTAFTKRPAVATVVYTRFKRRDK
jgi:hypothetical protein